MDTKGKGSIAKMDPEEKLSAPPGFAEKLSAPPGFVSLTAFILKRLESNGVEQRVDSKSAIQPETSPAGVSYLVDDGSVVKKNLCVKKRPWIVYGQRNDDVDGLVVKEADMVLAKNACLPKGVVRGCRECGDCQKVTARWDPEHVCRILLKEAPLFHPDEEEFKDTLKYIESISKQVEPYGLCQIVPPSSWNPPSILKDNHMWQTSTFVSHVQRIHELQRCCSKRKLSPLDRVRMTKRKRSSTYSDNVLGNAYSGTLNGTVCDVNYPESISGPQFTLQSFKNYADYFKNNYFSTKSSLSGSGISGSSTPPKQREISEENIEGEYWRIIENPTEEIEVLCGSSLNARYFGSGFPVSSNNETSTSTRYLESGWNLNDTSRLPGSLLAFERSDNSGILSPQLHVGMCFSSLPWKVEEHNLYALYYHHLGDPRIWYGVPGKYSSQFQVIMKKYFPDKSGPHSYLLHELVMQLSPTTLESEGVPVYRCVQRPGEFFLVLPGLYYTGFDCGFNCLESANFAPLDWLPYGQNVVELYREQRRKTSLSYDKLLLKAADEAVETQWDFLLKGIKASKDLRWKDACGKDGIFAKTLRLRVKLEATQREYLSVSSQSRKMDKLFDAGGKKECITCCCDLYISAATCPCNPNRYSCLHHARNLCPCAWSEKVFLFRYEISELDVLAEAVEGRYSAIRRWVKEKYGLALDLNLGKTEKSLANPAEDHSAFTKPSAEENREANFISAPSDHGKVDVIEKLLLEAKKQVLEGTSYWVQASGGDEHAMNAAMPIGNGKIDAIEQLILDAKKRILEEVPLDDAKGKGEFSSSGSSDDASSSSSSLKSDEEGSALNAWFEKNGSFFKRKREAIALERVSKKRSSENGIMECAEVDSSASSHCNSVTEGQPKVKPVSGRKKACHSSR